MNKKIVLTLAGFSISTVAWAGMEDDPLLFSVVIDQLEVRDTDGSSQRAWDIEAWAGRDLHKVVFTSEGEHHNGKTEELENQLLYSRAVSPYWDVRAGWRSDVRPQPGRDWLAIGFQGVAPYFIETSAMFFVGESGRSGARLQMEYELMFSQRLVLTPEIEFNLYGKDDPDMGIGSGLSDISAGLRLGYELRREFAPYIGINWAKKYGASADYARSEGEQAEDAQWLLGIRAWF